MHVIYPSWSAGPSSSAQFLFFYLILHFLPPALHHIITTTHSRVCVFCLWCVHGRGQPDLANCKTCQVPSIHLSVWTKVGQLLYLLSFCKQLRCTTDEISSKKRKRSRSFSLSFICRFQLNIRDANGAASISHSIELAPPPFSKHFGNQQKTKE